MQIVKQIFSIAFIVFMMACSNGGSSENSNGYEVEFYKEDLATIDDRITKFTIEQQWLIFKYGSNNLRPGIRPLEGIARAGKPMLSYVLNDIKSTTNDFDIVDSLSIANYMQRYKYYLVCNDFNVLNEIMQNKNRIKNASTRDNYQAILGFLLEQCI